MPIYAWILIVIGSIILIGFLVGIYIAFGVIKPNRRSLIETRITEEENYPGIFDFYEKHLKKEYKIKSRYGYDLAVYHFSNTSNNDKFIVMAHGHTYTHHGCLKYARMMINFGYDVILFDERYHGNSGGPYSSLGYYEQWDLHDVISDTFNRYGMDIFLGTYGESMGSATVLLELKNDDRVRFAVSDCGFSDFSVLLKEILKDRFHIPIVPFYYFGVFALWLMTRIRVCGISPKSAIKTVNIPVFFAHGIEDDYIPSHHVSDLFNAYQGPKEIFLAGNHALHADAYHKNTEAYEKRIEEFLEAYVNKMYSNFKKTKDTRHNSVSK